MLRVLCILVALMSLVAPVLVGAQGRDSVAAAPGALVRVLPVGETTWRTGRLTVLTADSLTLRACRECGAPAFARDQLGRVEVRRGIPGTRQRHVVLGMTVGTLLAVGASVASVRHCEARAARAGDGGEGPPCALGYVALPLVAVAGLVGGGFIGVAVPPERWHPVIVAR